MIRKKYDVFCEILEWLVVLFAIVSMGPYFIWMTYRNGIFAKILVGTVPLTLFLFCMMTGIYLFALNLKTSRKQWFYAAMLIIIFLVVCCISINGITIYYSMIMPYMAVSCFVILPVDMQRKVFYKFWCVYALIMVPSIVIWCITSLGFSIPYNVLIPVHPGKKELGAYYQWYPGAVFLNTGNELAKLRFCGWFDEPGFVGTISGLLLIATKLKKDWKNVILFITGILSKSLAFWLVCLLYLLIRFLRENLKAFLIIFMAMAVAYPVFMSMEFNPSDGSNISRELYRMQLRLEINDGRLTGNNRTSEGFDKEYNQMWDDADMSLLLGNGHNASLSSGSYSYKNLIYDYGVIGFLLLMGWILGAVRELFWRNRRNEDVIYLLFVFMVSIYQRPYVFNLYYMIILLGGSAYLNNQKSNGRKILRTERGEGKFENVT